MDLNNEVMSLSNDLLHYWTHWDEVAQWTEDQVVSDNIEVTKKIEQRRLEGQRRGVSAIFTGLLRFFFSRLIRMTHIEHLRKEEKLKHSVIQSFSLPTGMNCSTEMD